MSESATATTDAPKKKQPAPAALTAPAAAPAGSPRPCVGLPVQYCHQAEGVVPAVLQSQSRANPELWNVRVFLNGAVTSVVRAEVRRAETPTPGHWNFLPAN